MVKMLRNFGILIKYSKFWKMRYFLQNQLQFILSSTEQCKPTQQIKFCYYSLTLNPFTPKHFKLTPRFFYGLWSLGDASVFNEKKPLESDQTYRGTLQKHLRQRHLKRDVSILIAFSFNLLLITHHSSEAVVLSRKMLGICCYDGISQSLAGVKEIICSINIAFQ